MFISKPLVKKLWLIFSLKLNVTKYVFRVSELGRTIKVHAGLHELIEEFQDFFLELPTDTDTVSGAVSVSVSAADTDTRILGVIRLRHRH
jgi:hypothetical protein